MSSPIAKNDKSGFDKALIAGHQTLSHGHRVRCLVEVFSQQLDSLGLEGSLQLLDVGCGDMSLARGLAEAIPGIKTTCVDIYPPPSLEKQSQDPFWKNYEQFDGWTLPYDKGSFDVAIFSDVLHHVPPDRLICILESAARAARFVLIKDHFEYGYWSRQCLRAMDFIGNYGYGVSVPDHYFTPESFVSVIERSGLAIDQLVPGIRLYDHLPIVRSILAPRWQFIARCSTAALG